MAPHREARQSEHAIIGEAPKRDGITLNAGIADDSNFRSHLGLSQRKIVDVAEEASNRRAQAMQNTERGAHSSPAFKNLG
jgi:hypothetical protein